MSKRFSLDSSAVYQKFECGYCSPILNLSSKTMSNNKQMSDMK